MCRHDEVGKGISAAVEVGWAHRDQGGTEHTGAKWNEVWRRAARGFDGRTCQNCRAQGVITAFVDVTENRRDACVHLPVNRQLLAAGGICPQSAFCLKWDMARPSTHPSIPLCSSATLALLLPEAFRLLDGKHQLLLQLLVALVRWQVQSVEAATRMTQHFKVRFTFLVSNIHHHLNVAVHGCGKTTTTWKTNDTNETQGRVTKIERERKKILQDGDFYLRFHFEF